MTTKRKNQRGGRGGLGTASGRKVAPSALDPVVSPSLPPLLPELYINRELSWLEFNRRVLDEGLDRTTPLLERVKFAAIFATNLDEFFMIRVAGLKRKLAAGIADPGPDGRLPIAQFTAVRALTQELLASHSTLLKELMAALFEANVCLVRHQALTEAERTSLGEYFERDIFPVLTPQAIDRARRFPHVSNQSLNLIVVLRSETAGQRLARIKIPAVLPRLVRIPSPTDVVDGKSVHSQRYMWLEDLTFVHLDRLFPGNDRCCRW
jgi:polyphosphate kinase